MADNLALKLAHRRVHSYVDEILRQHAAATDCQDCEEFLQKGIDAFKWVRRAEETMREADYEGLFTFTSEVQEALDLLYGAWLSSCEYAEQWIAALRERGDSPENVDEFRLACIEARELVERRDWQNRAARARVLADSEEPW